MTREQPVLSLTSDNLTVDEVRAFFRLTCRETVRRWHRKGKLVGFKAAGNVLLFKRDDVLAYRERRLRASGTTD